MFSTLTATDIDECVEDPEDCGDNCECLYTDDSFTCPYIEEIDSDCGGP